MVTTTERRPASCRDRLRDEGRSYPRTCPQCGIYKCRFGELPTVAAPPLAPEAPAAPKHWIQTLPRLGERHGRAFDLVNPTPDMIDFDTVATVLARVPRFGGQTGGGVLSVAQHSLEGARALFRDTGSHLAAAAFLIHDAHEAYIGDIATPVAQALADIANQNAMTIAETGAGAVVTGALKALKARIDAAVFRAAGLPWPLPDVVTAAVKEMDRRMLESERRARLAIPPHAWREQYQPIEGADLYPWTEGMCRAVYRSALFETLPALRTVKC